MAKEHSEKFFGACKLCGGDITSSNKVRSHALTKAVYSNEMPLEHGEHLMMLHMENGKVVKGDFGAFETETGILCKKCDESLKIYEDERTAFFRENKIISFNGQAKRVFNRHDCKKVKKAFLADLFRCSCFKKKVYSGVSLGKAYEERIRKILNGEDDSENEFPIWLSKYRDAGGICAGASMCPCKDKRNGVNYYRCLMPNGWKWVIKIDKRSTDCDGKSSFVNEHIIVFNGGDIQNTKMFKSMLKLV